MSYEVVTIETASQELDRLHSQIEEKLRSTVQDAIRAGEILTQVKDRLPHGDFLPWLKANCSFSQATAYNYVRVYSHSDKITSVGNLQEAYKQIETIEKQEKQTEYQQAQQRVQRYKATGVKPEGWRRGTDDKLAMEEEERKQRVAAAQRRAEEAQAERAQKEAERQERARQLQDEADQFEVIAEKHFELVEKRRSFKDRIRLSDMGAEDPFIDALMDYLEELPDDNRRIEACTNIIKVARNISSELQRGESA